MAKISSTSVYPKKNISKTLITQVKRALRNSYAPYSNINVSAGVYCTNGAIYTGVNIENSSYSLTMCAERTALFNAISAGEHDFSLLLVYSPQIEHILPCGACLQVLYEFAPEIIVVTMDNDKQFKFLPLTTMLNKPFRLPIKKKRN